MSAAALAKVSGDAKPDVQVRPARAIDLVHLGKQTMGDRALEQEVLRLFVRQALSLRDDVLAAKGDARMRVLHTLKGSARTIGAFPLADCLAALEGRPTDRALLAEMSERIGQVCNFAAAISR